MKADSPRFRWEEILPRLKMIGAVIVFIFSLGVGYQSLRLEEGLTAKDEELKVRLMHHEEQGQLDRSYMIRDLAEIKQQLNDIQRYLREKK